jgi:CheY-like chemotaxis protein
MTEILGRILVVDDSKMFRNLVGAPLVEAGYEVRLVDPTSVCDVLKQMHAFDPDLLVTDYWMPTCNGAALVRALRADPAFQALKIVMLSSHGADELDAQLRSCEVNAFLPKSKGLQALVSLAGELL